MTDEEKKEIPTPHKIVLDRCLNQTVADIKVEDGAFTEIVLRNGVRIQPYLRKGEPRLRVEISRKKE